MPGAVAVAGVDSLSGHGERAEGEEPLLWHKVTDWATQQEVLGFDLDKERMTISLPARKISELQKMLEDWPAGGRTAMVREVLVLKGKLRHVAYVIRPGRYFVQRLLQLSKLHLNGQEKRGGSGEGVGSGQKQGGCWS